MKIKLVSLTILILLFLVSCTGYPHKVAQTTNPASTFTTENTETKELQLSEEAKVDKDSSLGFVKLQTLCSEENNTFEFKLTIDDKSTNYKFEYPSPFNRAEKIQFLNFSENKKIPLHCCKGIFLHIRLNSLTYQLSKICINNVNLHIIVYMVLFP